MEDISSKIVTYSLLAHINDNKKGIEDLSELFIPIVKRVLAQMTAEGITKGEHINEIKQRIDKSFFLDIPFPLLDKIIKKIVTEVASTKGSSFIVYKDKAFLINNYTFTEFEDDINEEEMKISKLEALYDAFLEVNQVQDKDKVSLIEFLDKNRFQVIGYFSKDGEKTFVENDFSVQANFLKSIKSDTNLYKILCKIYLGSIIASYLEFEPAIQTTIKDKEFLLDTNFIVGLLDLNSIESKHTCQKIVEICNRLNYRMSVLDITLEETNNLIERAINNLDSTFLQKKLDPDSIFNACDRRGLSKTDLEKILANLGSTLQSEFAITIVHNSSRFQNEAKYSKEFEIYKGVRSTEWSALHDATAIKYVQWRRSKKYKDYFSANCFFVTNTGREFKPLLDSDSVSEIIRAEDLVNILWLTNPNVKLNLKDEEVVNIGLSRLISSTLNSKLPSSRIIRDLDQNIQKYAKDKITDQDIIRVANRIADKTLTNLDGLNKLASKSPDEFVIRLTIEARKDEERQKKFIENIRSLLVDIKDTSDEKLKEKEKYLKEKYDEAVNREKDEFGKQLSSLEKTKNLELREAKSRSLKQLNHTKEKLDKKASNQTHLKVVSILMLPILIGFFLVFNYKWNDLEPFIYLAGLFYYMGTYLYFYFTNKVWSPIGLYNSSLDRKKLKIYSKYNFDFDYYKNLSDDLKNIYE